MEVLVAILSTWQLVAAKAHVPRKRDPGRSSVPFRPRPGSHVSHPLSSLAITRAHTGSRGGDRGTATGWPVTGPGRARGEGTIAVAFL